MKVEIWSDFACPFCYLGHVKFELAVAQIDLLEPIEVVFKSFQLDTNATSHPGVDINTLISRKYSISYEQAKASNQKIIEAAKAVGLNYDFERLKPGNTGLAHEAAKYARSMGMEKVFVERLFKAYLEEGVDLGVKENLLNLASQVGLDSNALDASLNAETFKSEVVEDQQKARVKGINGVPYFIIKDKYSVSGAQSVEYFKQTLKKAQAE